MHLQFQESSIDSIKRLVESGRHSILIDGTPGSGKTYIGNLVGDMVGTYDIHSIAPKVSDIREHMASSYDLNSPAVYCIENLDTGVPAASHTILKFLEEPNPFTYIVVTCRSMYSVPDTIVSRSSCLTVPPPHRHDIDEYAENIDSRKFSRIRDYDIWSCMRNLNDVDSVFLLSQDDIKKIQDLPNSLSPKDSVSTISWKIRDCIPDNSSLDASFVISYLMKSVEDNEVAKYGVEAVKDLESGRMGQGACINKFAFDIKYGTSELM